MAQANIMAAGKNKAWLDRVAIALSGLCLVHCVASVVFITLLASAGGLLLHPLIHEVGLAIAIVLAAVALGRGWRLHRALPPALIGVAGLLLMGSALTVEHGYGETALTIAGVGLVALAHHLNRRALLR